MGCSSEIISAVLILFLFPEIRPVALGVAAVFKINVIPHNEDEQRPDAAAIVPQAVEMTVQQPEQLLGVEEFLGNVAGESGLDNVVILLVFQPDTGGNREAQLLFLSGCRGRWRSAA